MTALAQTDEGQHLFSILADCGMSPREWRELDIRDRWFLIEAKSESNRRINRQRQ
jgi:hypothetical protein